MSGKNEIKASKDMQDTCKSLACYELAGCSHGGNEPFPRRERTVSMKGTMCNHQGNDRDNPIKKATYKDIMTLI